MNKKAGLRIQQCRRLCYKYWFELECIPDSIPDKLSLTEGEFRRFKYKQLYKYTASIKCFSATYKTYTNPGTGKMLFVHPKSAED